MSMIEGVRVTLVIADPWDLVGSSGTNRFGGFLEEARLVSTASNRETFVVRLHQAITYHGVEYDRVVLQPRDEEPSLQSLGEGRTVEASVYGLPVGYNPASIDPGEWWRGGLGATASVIPT